MESQKMDDRTLDASTDISCNTVKGNIHYCSFFDSPSVSTNGLESISEDDIDIANSGDVILDSALPLWAKVIRVVVLGLIGLCLVSSILIAIFPERQTQATYAISGKEKSDVMKAKMDKFWKDDAKAWAASQAKAEADGQKILAKK